MDEWLSLTEEMPAPRKSDESDILFDLHKVDGPGTSADNEEILKIGPFLEVCTVCNRSLYPPNNKHIIKWHF